MDLKLFIGIIFGVALVAGVSIVVPVGNSAQPPTPPPTPAYPTIHIINNATWPNSSDTSITAIKYNDEWILAADNSILINITSLTP
jgi:hypothetical protein